jgi:hypothetical protein
MTLFRDNQIDHIAAAPVKQSNIIETFGGITITNPSHLNIAFHTTTAKSQNKNRWATFSSQL